MNDSNPDLTETACLCTLLRQASRAISCIYDQTLRDHGLKVTQFAVLSRADRMGRSRQSDLGNALYLDVTSLTRALKPLVESGWLQVTSGADRREKWISVTPLGKQKIKDVRPAWRKLQREIKSRLSEGEWEKLFEILPNVAKTVT